MPELPEVETTRRGVEPHVVGHRVRALLVHEPRLRWRVPASLPAKVQGATVLAAERRAKYLLFRLEGGALTAPATLLVHLGMSGNLRVLPAATPRLTHDHFDLMLDSGETLRFNDPRRFGSVDLWPTGAIADWAPYAARGPEPWGPDFTPDHLARPFKGRVASIKAMLLDQRVVAGLGNIYVCEALHRAHISPFKPAGGIAKKRLGPLTTAIKDVLAEAVEVGGSTLKDFAAADGALGYFQHRFRVYDREGEPCPTPGCKGVIAREVQAGRSTFFCPVCQV